MKLRTVVMLVVCLAVGFAAQSLAAWVLFIHCEYTDGTGVLRDEPLTPGHRTVTGFVVPPDWTQRTRVEWWGFGKTRELVSEAMWMGSTLGTMQGLGRQATYQGFAAGWPVRSFFGLDYLSPGVSTDTPAEMFSVPEWLKLGGFKVPVSIRWQGAIVNTALHALPFITLALVMPRWRRARRRRRGQCVKCGYLVAGLPRCPECGAERSL